MPSADIEWTVKRYVAPSLIELAFEKKESTVRPHSTLNAQSIE